MLLRSVYHNLLHIITANSNNIDREDIKSAFHEIALTLLQVKYTHPFLEHQETGNHAFDYDASDKLLHRLLADKSLLANRDYLKLRNMDSVISTLTHAQPILAELRKSNHKLS